MDAEEACKIDGLHVVLEGLLMMNGRIYDKSKVLGVLEYVSRADARQDVAMSLTFVACTYSSPDTLTNILQTG